MAKNIYICSKDELPASIESRLFEICKRLEPDNINPRKPRIYINGHIAYGIMNPTNTIQAKGDCLLMGEMYKENEKWDIPLEEYPDGSYALFRDRGKYCEIITDSAASRTIWYFLDDTIFVSSTSQRAIVMFLGSFEFNDNVIPWMLSAGSLGPEFSWDKRIKRVPVDSSVILNKDKWTISIKSNRIEFKVVNRSDEQHEQLLSDSIRKTFKSLNLDYTRWILPLSGGYDSRGILCFLRDTKSNLENLKTITWGLEQSQGVKGNDAYIAKELSKEFNVAHNYYLTDVSKEPIDQIINRFIMLGEGRTDNLKGYMDGFKVWKYIYEDGVEGIIRGDEGFGCKHYTSATIIRINQGCGLCSDYSNLRDYQAYGLPAQVFPEYLKQRKNESLVEWKDRLFHEHDLPTEFSALSDLKLSFVEVINPLLSKTILEQVRQLPDHLRLGKTLFKKIVVSLSPDIDFAVSEATATSGNILRQNYFATLLKNELTKVDTRKVFPDEFLKFISGRIKSEDANIKNKNITNSPRSVLKKIVPQFVKEALHSNFILPATDDNVLAFRILLISRMNKILHEDSHFLSTGPDN